ncbi:MAG TPA: PhnD/SsuA/transferrin family substrate-binding protein, partial [Urbifossiella sp.]|nr:PhnD/SsuA/transferrin family substrate-binding protein [Urbifossiella sp.]
MSHPSPVPPPTAGGSYRFTALLVLVLVAAAGGYYLYERSQNPTPPPVDEFAGLKDFFRLLAAGEKLAPEYADADDDLVADSPKDAAKFRAADVIGFSAVGTPDEERRKADETEWTDFAAVLAGATGRKVEYRGDLCGPNDQMAALKEGRLQVTAFNTGAVPKAVAAAGFVPMFAPADAAGRFGYQALILVRADSPVKTPADLKGKTLAFVALSSNSGARAPMLALHEKLNLLPGRDYAFKLSGDHFAAIADLLDGRADAACVASDLKNRAFSTPFTVRGKKYEPKPEQVRAVYTSDDFPPLCFGVP